MSAQNLDRHVQVRSPSETSLTKTQSVRSQQTNVAPSSSRLKSVITSPPWARDEPESPTEQFLQLPPSASAHSFHARPSQSTADASGSQLDSTGPNSETPLAPQEEGPSWWTFTRKGRQEGPPALQSSSTRLNWPVLNGRANEKRKRPMRERARSTWLAGTLRSSSKDTPADEEAAPHDNDDADDNPRYWGLRLPLPAADPSFTLAHSHTPGWDTPWSPRGGANRHTSYMGAGGPHAMEEEEEVEHKEGPDKPRSKWYHRRKRIRSYVLINPYVPLLFRTVNVMFTTAALAIAISIRRIEMRFNIMGAIGSSVTLVIIFAPLTLIHVMIAIYLEYFGRPLGLWRTTMKLVHTLSETLFICAWSAALSLCFDNFFTSPLGCAPNKSISWYSSLGRPTVDVPNVGRGPGMPGDDICDRQAALISLVFVGLVMYCSNLFISLFRIFEKVKYHMANAPQS